MAAVGRPLFDRGGFAPHAQAVFVALAGVALIAAALLDEKTAISLLRSAPILCLVAIAALSVLSTAWTQIEPATTLRWSLVVGGYGAMAVVGGVLSRRLGAVVVAAVLGGAAIVSGLIGLWAVAHRVLPQSEWLDGAWRPGGPFEYPNTLVLLQVSALVPLARAALARSIVIATIARGGLAIAAAALALAGSQTALGFAGVLLVIAIVWPRSVLATSRRDAIALCVCVLLAVMAAYLIAGGPTHRLNTGGDIGRIVGLGATIAAMPLVIGVARRVAGAAPPVAPLWPILTVCLLLVWSIASTVRSAPHGGPFHGRSELLRVGVETSLEHPLLGAGAGAFAVASSNHQAIFASHTLYAHDLPLELWAELGLIGLALIVILYLSVGHLVRETTGIRDAALLVPCVVAFLLSNLIDWSWHQPAMAAIWALCLGALVEVSERRVDTSPPTEAIT